MLLLRIGREARWAVPPESAADPDRVEAAALDLKLDPDEEGLSVSRVGEGPDQREFAIRFALACRAQPAHLDFVVFPAHLATDLGLIVREVPSDECDPGLNARHVEISGLSPELTVALARAILASPERRVERVRKQDFLALAAELCRTRPELRGHLKPAWDERIAPLLG